MKMDMMKAMDIAEGLEKPKDEKEFIKAWQFEVCVTSKISELTLPIW